MFNIVLFEPEIPPNTGNIIRLCANSGCRLQLVEPLGFEFTDTRLKRAGLDYHEYAEVTRHANLADALSDNEPERVFAFSTHATTPYHKVAFQPGDTFVFGPETRGLPQDLRESWDSERLLKIPLRPQQRSLNLANAVSIVMFEAWRQLDFAGSV